MSLATIRMAEQLANKQLSAQNYLSLTDLNS